MGVLHTLLPLKFFALVGHVVASAALLYMMYGPVQVSLPAPARNSAGVAGAWNAAERDAAYQAARYDLVSVVGWSFGCFFLEVSVPNRDRQSTFTLSVGAAVILVFHTPTTIPFLSPPHRTVHKSASNSE